MFKLLLPVMMMCGVANAAAPVAMSYRDFSGGLNNYNASVSLQANESPNLMNVVVDEPLGALSQRKGYLTCGNTPSGNTATALYEYSKNDGSRNLIVSDNVSVWQTADCVVFSTITTGLSAQALPRFATIQDKLWIVNGSTCPQVWDGSTLYYLDGINNRPLGPQGKYIAYWKSRVWIANTPTSPSGVRFTSLTDTNGNILDPATSTAAWANALNLIYFNRDDGSPIYGIKVYRDNMYVFKETGISRLVFESEFDLSIAKNVSAIGSKFQESIVEMDDSLLRFVGRDGVYAFDGSAVKRISTKWTPTFYTLKQPTISEQFKLWDTATDWVRGSFDANISTSVIPGSIALSSSVSVDNNLSAQSGNTSGWATNSFTLSYEPKSAFSPQYIGNYGFVGADCTKTTFPSYTWQVYSSTGVFLSYPGAIGDVTVGPVTIDVTGATGVYFKLLVNSGNCSGYYIQSSTLTSVHKQINFLRNITTNASAIRWRMTVLPSRPSTGSFTSDISTAAFLSLWKTFDTDEVSNGQSITYQIRTAATVGAVNSASWRDITPGTVVSTTTNGFVQWKANFATTDKDATPVLNSASIGWITGGSTKSPITAVNYKSRYWLSGSTYPSNDYNDMVMVESKSPLGTHTRYDLPLSAMTLWNNNLYGAIGNTSKIARIDYGETDDGDAINSYWESRDEVYENPIYYKTVNVGVVDYSNSPANTGLSIGLSPDMGSTYQTRTVDISASTLPRNTTKLNFDANTALGFRTKVSNNVLGIGFKIYGLYNAGTILDFYGN